MKNFSIFVRFVFVILSFLQLNTVSAQKLKLVQATSQAWHGGVKGSGAGINYQVILVAESASKKLMPTRVWIGQKSFPAEFIVMHKSANVTKENEKYFASGDTIIIKFTELQPSERLPDDSRRNIRAASTDTIQPPPPIKYVGEGLLAYDSGKKKKYLVIEKIEKLEPLAYP